VPLLHGYGFDIPDNELHQDADGQWKAGSIDWEPLKATMRNGGPDSARRIATAAANWVDTAWVRESLEQ
jgi:ring-1,2-phenylacetyl-CoA epoxidase subunit PaaA